MTSEPTLSQVHADMVARLNQDERLRAVEQELAAIRALPAELLRVETRLMTAIQEVKPKPVWPVVSALVAAIGLLLLVAQALYAK